MSEIKLFRIDGQNVSEVPSSVVGLEKSLQTVIENNLETILGVRFLSSEHSTGRTHGGRIDTLGIDENGCPVILEYKRATNENVINQGLFYLDWLLDHKADFRLLVARQLGEKEAAEIDWTSPRLICIAADFTRYDEHAVKQISRNIDLVRYRLFGKDMLALELVNRASSDEPASGGEAGKAKPKAVSDKSPNLWLNEKQWPMRDLFETLRHTLLAQGDDVQEKMLKLYVAYRRIKNFASIVAQKKRLLLYLKLDPDTVQLERGFISDVRNTGHWGTGHVEVALAEPGQLRKIEPLIVRAYQES